LKLKVIRVLSLLVGASSLLWLSLPSPAASRKSLKSMAQEESPEKLMAEKCLGSPSAPIKIVVFSDYECPSCGQFYEGTERPMIDDYVATGKVYLVHRDFPLPMHKYSREAARWANAAARIGKFEAVDRVLFDNQAAWGERGPAEGQIAKFVATALTAEEFRRVEKLMQGCESLSHDELPGCAVDAEIQRDIAAGELIPVRATPTFVISYHGQSYPPGSGVISWPIMKKFLDQLLSQK
jgi:protein-disulfide isomerase